MSNSWCSVATLTELRSFGEEIEEAELDIEQVFQCVEGFCGVFISRFSWSQCLALISWWAFANHFQVEFFLAQLLH